MSHIEGDGVIEDIYYLLWRKDSPYKERLNILMPDTIVFRKGRPMAWYFTSSEGVVLRKKQTSLVYEEILAKFTKKASEGDIIAYFINVDEEKKLEKLLDRTYFDGPSNQESKDRKKELPSHEVEYFGLKEFKHTFSDYKNFEGKTGILQRFIHPYGTNNELIQAIWSPRVCVFTKRVNLRRLNETRFDVYERALTFDGPDFYSKNVPLRGGYIPGKLRATCDNIVRHIAYISYEKISINRLVGYFKVDQNENVWFLWTSSIRINETSKVHKKLSEYVDKPLCLEPCMQTSMNIRHIKTNFASRPVTLQMNEECTVCSKRVSKVALMSVTYRLLLGNEEILKRSEQSASQARLTKSSKNFDYDHSKPLTIRKASIGVPYFIKKLHPDMKLKDFQTLRDLEHFLIMKADVCEECYLIVSKEYEGGFPYKLTEAKKHSMLNATQSTFVEGISRRPETVGSNERFSSNKKQTPVLNNDDSNEEDNVMERSGHASSGAITVLENGNQRPQGLKGHKARLYNILPKDSPVNEQVVVDPSRFSSTTKSTSFPKFLNRTAWGHISSSFNKPGRLTGMTGESALEETKIDSFGVDHSSLKKDVMKVMGRDSETSFRFRSAQSVNKSQSNTSLAQIPSNRAKPVQKVRPQTTVAKQSKTKQANFFKAVPKKNKEDNNSKYKLDEVPDLFDDSNQDSHEFENILDQKLARNSENDPSYTSGPSQRETLRAVVAANNIKGVKRVQIQELDQGRSKLKGYLTDLNSEVNPENQMQDHLDQDMVLILANDAQKRQGKSLLIRDKLSRKENASASSSSYSQRLDTQGSSHMQSHTKLGMSSMRAASAKSSNLRFKKQDTFNEKDIIRELEDKIDHKFAKSYEEL